MLKIYHYHSIEALNGCFVITTQLQGGNSCWTGRVIFNRFESPTGSEVVSRAKAFGDFPSEEKLLVEIEDWIRQSLFERWTAAEMVDAGNCATAQ